MRKNVWWCGGKDVTLQSNYYIKIHATISSTIKIDNKMEKKTYMAPAMTTVQMRQMPMMSPATGNKSIQSSRKSYGVANDGVDDSELNSSGVWEWN